LRAQNFNKSREALNSTEEKLKSTLVELQKTSMDLVAKRSECQVGGLCAPMQTHLRH